MAVTVKPDATEYVTLVDDALVGAELLLAPILIGYDPPGVPTGEVTCKFVEAVEP